MNFNFGTQIPRWNEHEQSECFFYYLLYRLRRTPRNKLEPLHEIQDGRGV